jgi:hypothetical protein
VLVNSPPSKTEGAGNAGCALPRGLVLVCKRRRLIKRLRNRADFPSTISPTDWRERAIGWVRSGLFVVRYQHALQIRRPTAPKNRIPSRGASKRLILVFRENFKIAISIARRFDKWH